MNNRILLFDQQSEMADYIFGRLTSTDGITNNSAIIRNPSFMKLKQIASPLAMIIADTLSTRYEETLEWCRQADVPVLSVFGRGSTVFIGPLEHPGVPGCTTCLQMRLNLSAKSTRMNRILQRQFGDANNISRPLNLSKSRLVSLAEMIAAEVAWIVDTGTSTRQGTVGIFKASGEFHRQHLIPHHDCPRCNLRVQDSSVFGVLKFESRRLGDTLALRTRPVDTQAIIDQYFHTDLGFVSELNTTCSSDSFVLAGAGTQHPRSGYEVGFGSSYSYPQAQATAILEVLERICAIQATDRVPSVHASFRELMGDALHPASLGVHKPSVYASSNGEHEPFDEQHEYSWVWAHSTKEQRPILIPEQLAYYGKTRDKNRFIFESSNGCALGGSLEEAVLHGIFEVLERDGLMNMWYGQMPVPELMLDTDTPDCIRAYFDALKQGNYRLRLFDISHDLQIPSIFAVAVNQRDIVPKIISGSASHLNPREAVKSALRELMVQKMHLSGLTKDRIEQGQQMSRDSEKIRHLLDHVVAAAMPESYPRWQFLLDAERREPLTLEEAYPDVQSKFRVDSRDIKIILGAVLAYLHQRGFDVIVVDQTNAEVAYGGFRAVKVIIPGMTPVTFGYGNERLEGLTRVYELPYRLGYRSHVLTRGELNSYCHPLS